MSSSGKTHPRTVRCTISITRALLSVCLYLSTDAAEEPGPLHSSKLVDYGPLAFRPHVWENRHVSTLLSPWIGTNVVFLTTNGAYNIGLMSCWVNRLDQGWALYTELMPEPPRKLKHFDGRATIVAVPDFDFTCGAGCGYVGNTGIELAMFYARDFPAFERNTNSMPHYVFYEMGRNFFTLGDRHSAFTTGFAVFMRYVCMDTLSLEDEDSGTRRTIEDVERLIRKGNMPFLRTFTNMDGLSEKEPRVKDSAGQWVTPSDQPVTYASAMLRLWKENGGNEWLRRCFHSLAQCPPAPGSDREGALAQSWNWLVAASVAAKKDLSPVFVGDWRLPLSEQTRRELAGVNWLSKDLTASAVLEQVSPRWLSSK